MYIALTLSVTKVHTFTQSPKSRKLQNPKIPVFKKNSEILRSLGFFSRLMYCFISQLNEQFKTGSFNKTNTLEKTIP